MSRLSSLLLNEAKKKVQEWNNNQVATISPTPLQFIQQVCEELDLSSSDLIIDLGCGDGRWLTFISKNYSCYCWGIEIDQNRINMTKQRIKEENLSSFIDVIQCDLYSLPLHLFNIIIVYLSREGNEKLKEKIIHECNQHVKIIAVGFSFRGWKSSKTINSNGLTAYFYNLDDQKSN